MNMDRFSRVGYLIDVGGDQNDIIRLTGSKKGTKYFRFYTGQAAATTLKYKTPADLCWGWVNLTWTCVPGIDEQKRMVFVTDIQQVLPYVPTQFHSELLKIK